VAERRRPRAAVRAEAALADARRLLESGDVHGALRPLEKARKDYLQAADLDGLRETRLVVEEAYQQSDPADEPAYERLLYSSGQNVRFLSRRRAAEGRIPWDDPHPELDQPGRPEIRVERGLSGRDKRWIVLAAVLGAAVVAGVAIGLVLAYRSGETEVVNDTRRPVIVGVCSGSSCDHVTELVRLEPGKRYSTFDERLGVSRVSGAPLGCVDAGASGRVSTLDDC
jgi:hypothetical protein